jgi:hypothetical protein
MELAAVRLCDHVDSEPVFGIRMLTHSLCDRRKCLFDELLDYLGEKLP